MATAQDRLSGLVEWVKASSARRSTPLGREYVDPGPYAVFVPQALSLPPTPTFDPRHLPLWIPATQATADLPSYTQDPPTSQDHMAQRLRHLIWKASDSWDSMDGMFEMALLPLIDAGESLQTVLDRHVPGLDLNSYPVIFLPVWKLDDKDREWALIQLPFVP